jgi:hypothetical protein
VQTAVDAFSGSSVVGYMYKTHGLGGGGGYWLYVTYW